MIVRITDEAFINTEYIVAATGDGRFTRVWWVGIQQPSTYEIQFSDFCKKVGWVR